MGGSHKVNPVRRGTPLHEVFDRHFPVLNRSIGGFNDEVHGTDALFSLKDLLIVQEQFELRLVLQKIEK